MVDIEDENPGSKSNGFVSAANEHSGLNASEAEPREVNLSFFPRGTKFAQLVAADSDTFALTTSGFVYGWGTFLESLPPTYSVSR